MGKTHRPPGKDLQPLAAAFAKNPRRSLLRHSGFSVEGASPLRAARLPIEAEKVCPSYRFQRYIRGNAISYGDRATARWRQTKLTSKAV
jgi:hypothetical protein